MDGASCGRTDDVMGLLEQGVDVNAMDEVRHDTCACAS